MHSTFGSMYDIVFLLHALSLLYKCTLSLRPPKHWGLVACCGHGAVKLAPELLADVATPLLLQLYGATRSAARVSISSI